ncbi:MAG: DNA-processing protein DprA [Methanococcaceae archaeon]
MTKLNFEQFVDLRLLQSVDGIGPAKIRSIISRTGSVEHAVSADMSLLRQADGISDNLASRILSSRNKRDIVKKQSEIEFRKLEEINARAITFLDEDYPSLLLNIYDAPVILYVQGQFCQSDLNSIAVVGTRVPSHYGIQQAERFSKSLAAGGITIISGLARGIDSIAHRAALNQSARTVAVIGSGLDVFYPPENRGLLEAIAAHGVVVSEFELGTKPDAQNFPRRNRIISGLALGSLVIETAVNGGAMQTARFALEQNREVFAVPGNLGAYKSEGCNQLIQRGEAKLVTNVEDILCEVKLKLRPGAAESRKISEMELNLFEEKIVRCFDNNTLHIDEIAVKSGLSTADCLVQLLTLEFKGIVKQLPGKTFILI